MFNFELNCILFIDNEKANEIMFLWQRQVGKAEMRCLLRLTYTKYGYEVDDASDCQI